MVLFRLNSPSYQAVQHELEQFMHLRQIRQQTPGRRPSGNEHFSPSTGAYWESCEGGGEYRENWAFLIKSLTKISRGGGARYRPRSVDLWTPTGLSCCGFKLRSISITGLFPSFVICQIDLPTCPSHLHSVLYLRSLFFLSFRVANVGVQRGGRWSSPPPFVSLYASGCKHILMNPESSKFI